MVNARKHGMFYQNRKNIRQHNNRINTLPSVAGKITWSHFASLKNCAHAISRYAGCYVLNKEKF
jgi:hypothetical protein